MRTLNDNNYLKVWLDGHSPILFVHLKSDFPGLIDVLGAYTSVSIKPLKSMASAHKVLYLLLDLSGAECKEIESLIQYFEHNLAKRIKATFRYISIVKSRGQEGLCLKINSETPVGVFGNFFEALGIINDMRAKEYVLN